MMKPEFSKPFSAVDARAGAPFSGANGEAVRVLIWDRKHPKYPILAIEEDGEQEAIAFRLDGKATHGCGAIVQELVMLPLGLIDGKPVFVGDRLLDGKGVEFTVTAGQVFGPGCLCKWAPPAKVYPETTMRHDDMFSTYAAHLQSRGYKSVEADSHGLVAVVNAALRHAVDAEQVVPVAEVMEVARCMNKRGRTERDMAIATAVHTAALTAHPVARGCETSEDRDELMARIAMIDLATIISTVK